MSDYQTHVFTSTYTADVSGVCSAMYELGGMTILHDPSGCNSTYSTHDEPRWFDGKSLMFVSGLDEMTAVLGDDQVIIDDTAAAAGDLKPRFITLCGGSIPHIIAFDFKGTAHLIEKKTGIPVLPVATDGLKSYVSGVGMALTEWIKRFADPSESIWERMPAASGRGFSSAQWKKKGSSGLCVNLLGVTPLDFSINGNVQAMRAAFEDAGIPVNCCAAMGETFDSLSHIYRGAVNVVVSSAGRRPARFMEKKAGIPRVEGLPAGPDEASALMEAVRAAYEDGKSRILWQEPAEHEHWTCPQGQILVIGEEICSCAIADAINRLPAEKRGGRLAFPMWPDIDEGLPEAELIAAMRSADTVIADPLYRVVLGRAGKTRFIDFPHEAYSGRIYRKDMRLFAGTEFSAEDLLR